MYEQTRRLSVPSWNTLQWGRRMRLVKEERRARAQSSKFAAQPELQPSFIAMSSAKRPRRNESTKTKTKITFLHWLRDMVQISELSSETCTVQVDRDNCSGHILNISLGGTLGIFSMNKAHQRQQWRDYICHLALKDPGVLLQDLKEDAEKH